MNFPGLPLYFLVVLRTSGVMWAGPVFGSSAIPAQVRVAISLMLGLIIAPLAAASAKALPTALAPYLVLGVKELIIGLAIGYAASLVFAAFQYGGSLMDLSAGFSLSETISPVTGIASSPMTNLYYFLAVILFLVAGGHLLLIMALAESYRMMPVGGGTLTGGAAAIFSHLMGNVFVLGLTVAAPVVGALFFAMVVFSLLSRAIPQLNIFQVGFTLQTFLGIFILMLALPAVSTVAGEAFGAMFGMLYRLMGAMGG